MIKQFKILGDSFKQYKANGANTLIDDGIVNKISQNNINEIIKNFVDKKLKVFVYSKHKSDMSEERQSIGEVLSLSACNNEVGLLADIYFNNDGQKLLEKNSFYPSIEMSGILENFENNINTWSNCMLKALAFVEYPASSNVDLLCLSGIIEYNQDKELKTMDEKLKELMQQFEATGEVTPELLDLVKSDEELLKIIMSKALKTETVSSEIPSVETKETETTEVKENADGSVTETETKTTEPTKEEDEKKEEEKMLSMLDWQTACKKYAEVKGAVDVYMSGIEKTFNQAKKMYKSGLSLDEIVDYQSKYLSLKGEIKKEPTTVDLSAVKDDERFANVGRMFK